MGSHEMCLFVHVFLFLVYAFASDQYSQAQRARAPSFMFRSLYSFGDSFVDPGNNGYIPTFARSNSPPYGNDFPERIATGRFSNGLLFPDFLAYYMGVETYQLPYLGPDIDFQDSVTAISFASATSGFDPNTANKTNAIQMWVQLDYFKKYKARLQKKMGKKKANNQIKQALFYVNAGSDDFAFTYFQDGAGGQTRQSPREYEQFLLPFIQQFLQGLLDQGAEKIAVNGLPPLGCIPIGITLLPKNPTKSQVDISPRKRKCLDYVNDISKDFNALLREALEELQSQSPNTKITYIDFEKSLLRIIQNPFDYGFTEVSKGCCGTGLYEIGILCNQTTPVCADASKYVFWDAAHPTERAYEIIFNSNVAAIDGIIGS
ncbi:GDSL esterase/lipase At5g45960-like [Rhododendron vialii]|uniref:GDSL esterase/lipase At5g45960-like n=1 Tax=Rhododendron vialii TaxID=182163 RepID=UPI00265E3FE3|nr:GDSL esterase/lipase At5g45960-like [Rhododendron vialii]